MSVFIKGPAFPLNKKNVNDWGLRSSETENAINSLKSSVIRVCPRDDPHVCDLTEDPFSEIGRIRDAWRGYDDKGNDAVIALGEITDERAQEKIKNGTWEPNWSVYATDEGDVDGWSQGFRAHLLTLVRFPAWETARWKIIAASAEQRRAIKILGSYEIVTDDIFFRT